MPKRLAVGTRLISSSIRAWRRRHHRAAQARDLVQAAARQACVEALEGRTLLSTSWVVAPWGNDSGSGSVSQPFRTIQHAATVANWGDTVLIRGGTYHETVHPSHGGITFEPYNNESVTISGADPVGGWSGYSANIWQASMPWDLGEGNNEVFVNGQLVNEARWPNTSTNLSYPNLATIQSVGGGGGNVTIYDSHLSGGWQGADIHIMAGNGWYAQTGYVTGSGNGWLSFSFSPDPAGSFMYPRSGDGYYLYGKLQGIDTPGEWYRDNSGRLYLWAPNSGNPNSLDVEAKHRDYGFDLSGDSNVTVQNINLFACSIKTDGGSSNTVLNRLNATYISQYTWEDIGWNVPINTGIQLNGNNSILENSNIGWSAGDGVYVSGSNCRVTSNIIHDVDTDGGDSAGIKIVGRSATVDHNLIYNAGRCGIIDKSYYAQILSNTIHDVMLQTADGGAIYSIHQDGSGSQIAYNTIYNVHTHTADPFWFAAIGIMLDDYCSNFSIHDNTVAHTDAAVKMNFSSTGNQIYNNILSGDHGSIVGATGGNWSGTAIHNNVLYNGLVDLGGGASVWSNSNASGSPNLNVPGAPSVPAPAPAPSPGPAPTPSGGSSSGSSSSGSSSHGSSSSGSSASGSGSGGVLPVVGGGTSGSSSSGQTNSSGNSNSSGGSSTTTAAGDFFIGPMQHPSGFVGPLKARPAASTDTQIPAASYVSASGATKASDGTVQASGGGWIQYSQVNFGSGATTVQMQVAEAAQNSGLTLQLRVDGVNGKVIGTVRPASAKSKSQVQIARIRKTTGVHDLYLVVVGKTGQLNLNWLQFTGITKKKSK